MILAAVINSPVANAFVSTREGKTDITIETVREIPMPVLNKTQCDKIRSLVARYQAALQRGLFKPTSDDPEYLLKQIDAAVLDGYHFPPRLEREVLEYFRGYSRPTPHPFSEYLPKDCDFAFSLSRFLSPRFGGLTAKELLGRISNL